ncbi:MAG: flagellar hook-length control protein FliK, partial [Bacillota bacterium]|nr:flagellar hook-length control protein FliK [Bacillota bacterium]
KEEALLENLKEIKGDENLNLKDLKELKKSENDKGKEVKLEDVKSAKEPSQEKKVQTFYGESSQDNEFKEELNKKLDTLKENITSIDDKKEEKETTFSENLKNNVEEAKENFNKENIMTEAAGKNIEKPVAGKENIIDQLAKNITTGKTESGNFIKIQLKPEVLGEMTVKLTEGKEGMIATISAEKEVVKNILRNSGEQITTMLLEKNIKVSSVVIETNESEKQDFNLFSDNSQEDFTGKENSEENFSNSSFSKYGGKIQGDSSHKHTDEIYSGNGINFYI